MTPRRLAWLVIVGCVVFTGVRWFGRPAPYARVWAELDAADPGWRFADIHAARLREQPPPDENVVLVAVAAGKLVPQEFRRWKVAGEPDGLPTPAPPPADPEGEAAWQAAAEAVAVARRCEHLTAGWSGTVVAADPSMTLLPHIQDATLAVELLQVAALHDPAAAAGPVTAVLNIARGVGREPFHICHRVAVAHRLRAADTLMRCLARAEVPADRLTALKPLLAEAADPAQLATMLRDWRAAEDLQFTALADGQADIGTALRSRSNAPARVVPGVPERFRYRIAVGVDHAASLHDFNQLLDIARRPPHEWQAAEAMPPPPDDPTHRLSHATGEQARKWTAGHVRHLARLRTAAVAVACERFRQRHGRWPATVADLPGVDAADPYTGLPLVLKRLPDGLAVYSLGPDRQDDGGTFGPAPADPPRQDIGYRLWDVPIRGH